MKKIAVLALVLVLLALTVQARAQGSGPWQRPGTRAGEEIVGPDGGRMVWVPAGEFLMGSADGAADERPAHRVRLSRGFWLAKTEVTVARWQRYCQQAGVPLTAEILTPEDHPMWGVSWQDVQRYCSFYGLALPTEAQWEWAARGPEGRRYPWGNQWDPARCCNQDNPGPEGVTCPVGSFPAGASWCGALDMAGNLAEWCADWYSEAYYATSPEVDPQGPAQGTERVWRGGYCWADADECITTRRFGSEPDNDGGAGCLRPCYVP